MYLFCSFTKLICYDLYITYMYIQYICTYTYIYSKCVSYSIIYRIKPVFDVKLVLKTGVISITCNVIMLIF